MSFKPIVTAVCFSLALFLLLFMVWPKYQELQNLNQQVEQMQTKLQQNKEYVARLQTLDQRLQENQGALQKVNNALPSQPKLPSLLNFIHSTSDNHGLLLKEVGSISQVTYQENIKQVNVSLLLVGSYSSFKNFVRAVEKSSRIINIDKVDFRMPEEEGTPPQFEVQLSTHYYDL